MVKKLDSTNLALCTTSWVTNDEYSDFDFSLSSHPALKLYNQGEEFLR
jgi:hypothetical protein